MRDCLRKVNTRTKWTILKLKGLNIILVIDKITVTTGFVTLHPSLKHAYLFKYQQNLETETLGIGSPPM